jgi:predicted MFS family arabinose efflux permease
MSEAVTGELIEPSRHAERDPLRLTASEWGLLLLLASMQFTHIVDFMIIMPLGPRYMKQMGLHAEEFSRMVGAYTLAAGLANLFAARFVDRFDRKSALLFTYAGFGVATLLCAAAPDYTLLVGARAVAGAFGGVTAATVYAIVGDIFPDVRRGTAMSILMYGFSAATIFGVPMGLVFAEWFGWQAPFVILGVLSGVMFFVGAAILPSCCGHLSGPQREPVSAWAIAADPNHVRAFVLMLALVASSFLMFPFVSTFLTLNVGMMESNLKYMYLVGGLSTLVSLTFFGRLSDRFGKLRIFRIAAFACLLPFVGIPFLPPGSGLPLIFVATTSLFVFSSGRMVPGMALITNAAAPRVRGGFMSLITAVQHLGAGVASWASGVIVADVVVGEAKQLVGYQWAGILAGVAIVLSLYLAGRLQPEPGGEDAPDEEAVGHHGVAEPEGIIAG